MEARKAIFIVVASIMAVALIAVVVHHSDSPVTVTVKLPTSLSFASKPPVPTELTAYENGACGSEVIVYNKGSNDALLDLSYGQGYPVSGQFSMKAPGVTFASTPHAEKQALIRSCKMTKIATTDMDSVKAALSFSGSGSGSGTSGTAKASGTLSGAFSSKADTSSNKAFWGWKIECSTGMQTARGASLINGCPKNNGACFISGMKRVSILTIGAEVAFASGNAQMSASASFKADGSDTTSGATASAAGKGASSIDQSAQNNAKNLQYSMYGVKFSKPMRGSQQQWNAANYETIVNQFYDNLEPAPYSVRTTLYTDINSACVDHTAACVTRFNQAITRISNTVSTVIKGLEKAQSDPSSNKVAVRGYLSGGFFNPWNLQVAPAKGAEFVTPSKVTLYLSVARNAADNVESFKQLFNSDYTSAGRCDGAIPTFAPQGFEAAAGVGTKAGMTTVYQWLQNTERQFQFLVPWAKRVARDQCPGGTTGTGQVSLVGISKCDDHTVNGNKWPWCSQSACCSATSIVENAIQISCNGGWGCNWWKCS